MIAIKIKKIINIEKIIKSRLRFQNRTMNNKVIIFNENFFNNNTLNFINSISINNL